jgi:hypothetical protein
MILFRAFNDLFYANEFVHGRLRIKTLASYRHIEGPQQDPLEGFGNYSEPSGLTHTFNANNVAYLLCCSNENIDFDSMIRTGMGKYFVKIEDPDALASDINDNLINCGWRLFGTPKWHKVCYSKAQVIDSELDPFQRFELSYSQKPESFKHEQEVRLVVLPNIAPYAQVPDHLNLDIGLLLKYAYIV